MAIAFDAASGTSGTFVTGLSWTHTAASGATAYVGIETQQSQMPATVAWGGVTMTLVSELDFSSESLGVYVLHNPPTGASTVTVTPVGGFANRLSGSSATYTGVAASPDSEVIGTATNVFTSSLTATLSGSPSSNNEWLVGYAVGFGSTGLSNGTGATLRNQEAAPSNVSSGWFDGNAPISPPSATSAQIVSSSGASTMFMVVFAIPPATATAGAHTLTTLGVGR